MENRSDERHFNLEYNLDMVIYHSSSIHDLLILASNRSNIKGNLEGLNYFIVLVIILPYYSNIAYI